MPLAVRSRGLRLRDVRGGDPKGKANDVEKVGFMSVTGRENDTRFLVCTDDSLDIGKANVQGWNSFAKNSRSSVRKHLKLFNSCIPFAIVVWDVL